MRVLVTGSSGYIGRHLVAELVRKGYDVEEADNRNIGPGTSHDLREKEHALSALKNIDVCVALAARSGGIRFFNRIPAEILDDNLRILSSTFEAARLSAVSKIVYVSSSCVFDRSSVNPITEAAIEETLAPPYGYPFSKFVGEMYCKAYYKQYGLPYVIIRPFNVYGTGEMPGKQPGESHVIPDLAYKALTGQTPLEIFGDGSQTRSFTHITDIVAGIILSIETPRAVNKDFNLGHYREISVRELAGKLWDICGRTDPLSFNYAPAFQVDVKRRSVDCSKARALLGWEPLIDLHQGLAEYVAWLKEQIAAVRRAS